MYLPATRRLRGGEVLYHPLQPAGLAGRDGMEDPKPAQRRSPLNVAFRHAPLRPPNVRSPGPQPPRQLPRRLAAHEYRRGAGRADSASAGPASQPAVEEPGRIEDLARNTWIRSLGRKE